MTDPVLANESCESFKGGVHLALFGLASICAAYNIGAYCVRPERHLLGNSALYLTLAIVEAAQIKRHWRDA